MPDSKLGLPFVCFTDPGSAAPGETFAGRMDRTRGVVTSWRVCYSPALLTVK